jgi:hypothetical protein
MPSPLLWLIVSILLSACSPKKADNAPPPTQEQPTYQGTRDWGKVFESLEQLPAGHKKTLGDAFFTHFDQLTENPLFRIKLSREEGLFPLFPGHPITLHAKSPFDGHPLTFTVRAPLSDRHSHLTLLLGEPEQYEEPLSERGYSGWLVQIPSRRGLNYQLTAEGDFWQILRTLTTLYPQLESSPTYLVGTAASADAALLLANHYRFRFAGVAFSGGSLGLRLSNLDHLPVASFGQSPARSPWSGHHLVETLQLRGNHQTAAKLADLSSALQFLQEQTTPSLAPYTFSDDSYAQVWPGLKVLARKSQKQPVILTANQKDNTLLIRAPNVLSVHIDRSRLPKGITHIRLNQDLYLLPSGQITLKIGEEGVPSHWRSKGMTPSRLLNFFRTDPVYIVYQEDAGERFSELSHSAAQKLSLLHFSGLPMQTDVQLPLFSLAEYQKMTLPPHRTILIGTSEKAASFLQNSAGYLPFDPLGQTFSLIYPPEAASSCKLAWVIAAPNLASLQKVTRSTLSLTTLYSDFDLKLYPDRGPPITQTFDSYWGTNEETEEGLSIPPQNPIVWETYVSDLILAETTMPATILSPLTDSHTPSPSTLSTSELKRFLPERRFAKITLRASSSATIANKILDATKEASIRGLDNYLTEGRFDPMKLRKKQKDILVEAATLKSLSPEELARLNHQILPFSLHELLQQQIEQDAHLFGRQLLRLNQTLNGELYR